MRVADILKGKGTAVMTIRPNQTVGTLAQRLRLAEVGAMIVTEDGHTVDGIISERDVAYGLAVYGAGLSDVPVSELMTRGVVTCSPSDTIADVSKIMTFRRIRHLPVKDGDRLAGIISIGDVLKHRLSEIELEASVLRDMAAAHF